MSELIVKMEALCLDNASAALIAGKDGLAHHYEMGVAQLYWIKGDSARFFHLLGVLMTA